MKHIEQGHYKSSRGAAKVAFDIITNPDSKALWADTSGFRSDTKNTQVALQRIADGEIPLVLPTLQMAARALRILRHVV